MGKLFSKWKHFSLAISGLALPFCCAASCTSVDTKRTLNSIVTEMIRNIAYYKDLSNNLSGMKLLGKLHDLITTTHTTYTIYEDSGKNLNQLKTDQAFDKDNNPVEGKIVDFYSSVAWPGNWDPNPGSVNGGYNREHVWCKSASKDASGKQLWKNTGAGADMHHLRPSEYRLNSTRNNSPFGEIKDTANKDKYLVYAMLGDKDSGEKYAGGYLSDDIFEPLDNKKGDVARILLYIYVHYNSYKVSQLFENYATTDGKGDQSYFAQSLLPLTNIVRSDNEQSAISLLLKWNKDDPVDFGEKNRNDQVYSIQGNRNPFIDCPSFADLIWDNN